MSRFDTTLDIENLVGFFQVKLLEPDTGYIHNFPMWTGGPPLDRQSLANLLARVTIYTFNGNNYDVPILVLALCGADLATLKEAGDRIIEHNMRPWEFYRHYGVDVPDYIDHVDVMEVAAGVRIGLKMYAGRTHAPTMQDLPIDPHVPVPPVMRIPISLYCDNDLHVTDRMRVGLADRLRLREVMSERYKCDLRSKSDAQIAETVIKAQLDFYPERRYIPHGYEFAYEAPDYIKFVTPEMQQLLQTICSARFVVSDKEEAIELGIEDVTRTGVQIPAVIKGKDIRIANSEYRIGIGGLHSKESNVTHYAKEGERSITDIDVASYYPSLILGMGMYPEQLGPAFLTIYRKVYEKRLHAKAEASRLEQLGNGFGGEEGANMLAEAKRFKTEADGLKIVLNGTFGKLFSKYSVLYAPEFGIRTTITGQLALLMLIEMMEVTGISVLSANTDGIVLSVPAGRDWVVTSNVNWWEKTTGLTMEYSHYRSLHSRDVNNYVAITTAGKVKRKGVFAKPGLIENKHPDKAICAEAVVKHLLDSTPIERTIRQCDDIRQFVVVRQVRGGAVYAPTGEYLGKAVRWYYGNSEGHIAYKSNGNKVAGSAGATPVMKLPTSLPDDINYQHYIDVALGMLKDIGL